MRVNLNQTDYWDRVAKKKTFNHEINWNILKKYIDQKSRILDYGCGYGRTVSSLYKRGYTNLTGADSSPEMINRAMETNPNVEFVISDDRTIPFDDKNFDCIVLFAVLTCIPLDEDLESLFSELYRILKPGGKLYISDLLINDDNRNIKRYREFQEKYNNYGTFELEEGVTVRHFSIKNISEILSSFNIEWRNDITFITMNGNESKGFQLIGSKK